MIEKNNNEINYKELSNQYETIGPAYIKEQEDYFNQHEDSSRNKLYELLGDMTDKVVLDVGCGSGSDIKECLNRGAKKIIGLDPSEAMLNEAKSRSISSDIDFKKGTYESIPLADESVDIVFGRFSLNYVKDLDKAFKEVFRVLTENGECIFLTTHPMDDLSLKKDKNLAVQEIISNPLYNDKIIVRYPSHNFSDYLSEYFLKNFRLDSISEDSSNEMKKDFTHPKVLFLKAKKHKA
jgi:ubiquinone/menaquinone biosynthesis C-methylase UbiE